LRRGILSYADRNILFVDEVNLLKDDIVNVILDAAAMGTFTVRRGAVSATYYARFNLIGTMNPEEGHLRPQIMDRFGLRVLVSGLEDAEERWQAYQRVSSYKQQPGKLISAFSEQTNAARDEISRAQQLLPRVTIPEDAAKAGLHLIQSLQIASLRAEITVFEAARAYTAADDRTEVTLEDLAVVAPLALRMRQSSYMDDFLSKQRQQDELLNQKLNELTNPKDRLRA